MVYRAESFSRIVDVFMGAGAKILAMGLWWRGCWVGGDDMYVFVFFCAVCFFTLLRVRKRVEKEEMKLLKIRAKRVRELFLVDIPGCGWGVGIGRILEGWSWGFCGDWVG